MADSIPEFDLIINGITAVNFGNWLISESARVLGAPVFLEDENIIFVHSPKLVSPDEAWPHHTFELEGTLVYFSDGEKEKIEAFQHQVGLIVSIEIRELTSEKIQIVGKWIFCAEPLEKLKEQIVRIFLPEELGNLIPTSISEDRTKLVSDYKRTLIKLHQNLQSLKEQKTLYGTVDVPLKLSNEIRLTEEEIVRIESVLQEIKVEE